MSKFRKISGKLMIFPFNTLVSSWFLSIRVVWASKYGRFSITKLPKMSTFFEKSPHLWCSQLSQNVDIFKKSLRPQYPQTIQNIDIFRNMSTSSTVQNVDFFSKKVDIQRFWSAFWMIWRHYGRRRCSEGQIEKGQNLRNMIDRRVSKTTRFIAGRR